MSYQNISFRRASAEELRLAALRQLIFEEPVSRLARLKKTIQRQLIKSDREKVRDRSIYDLASLHGDIFGCRDMSSPMFSISLAFNLALLLEDFRLYAPAAFSALLASSAAQLQTQDFVPGSVSYFMVRLAQEIAHILGLGVERKCWLTVGLLSTIDWYAAAFDTTDDSAPFLPSILKTIEAELAMSNLPAAINDGAEQIKLYCQALLTVARNIAPSIRSSLRPSLIVLVEGQSELIVIPHFARLKGQSFEASGVMVIASGGAQQVARRYLTMKDVLNIPIVCVFDGDAENSSVMIEEDLRDRDGLFCLDATELEDCYSYDQLLKILNRQLTQFGQVFSAEPFDIPRVGPRKQALNKLFRSRGLGDFDKIAFAHSTVDLALSREDVPLEMSRLIDYIADKCRRFTVSAVQS